MTRLRNLRRQACRTAVVAVCGTLAACTLTAAVAAEPANSGDHQDVTYVLTEAGERRPIVSVDDWQQRRRQVVAAMERVMGPLPRPTTPVPLDMNVVEAQPILDGRVERRKVVYHTDSADRWTPAYLFVPTRIAEPRAAVLCLHQTIPIGKAEPAGLGGNPNLHYALHLAERGYVTLAPDYPSFGEYEYDFEASPDYASGSLKAVYDNIRAVDLLTGLPEVDADRIGCIGHSLGGHNAMFTGMFEPRLKAIVSNCGFTRFHRYYEGRLAGWTSARYMPRIASEHHNNPDEVPFDFPEIVAGFAPRAFLASAPTGDDNFEVEGVRETIAAARFIYDLHGAGERLQAEYPECGHDFPAAARERAYRFLDEYLVHVPDPGR
ncbi:MAG: prolyl oligopeptidase family serine peptidase [Planctomyces sp.]|nr:prolyl oligopeptidase family serine peptidase [Planctomyces sp.]